MPITERERSAVDEGNDVEEATEARTAETLHGPRGAYRIEGVRGRGGFGTTYIATREGSAERVLVKELSLARAESWKAVELFEREAAVLARLSHPGIPRFIDSFVFDDAGTMRAFLVQELVEGPTLAERVRTGGVLSPAEATRLLMSLSEILETLHGHDPPIVHRDVTPSNIVLGADGRTRLVDFGAAQDRAPKTAGGSTMVGTAGYIPMEQLMGQARPASDIYALGMTIVFALTGREPATLPIDEAGGGVKLDDELRGVPSSLAWTLRRMTAPTLATRLTGARAVRTAGHASPRALLGVIALACVLGVVLLLVAFFVFGRGSVSSASTEPAVHPTPIAPVPLETRARVCPIDSSTRCLSRTARTRRSSRTRRPASP
ncbi:MAG: serine/threonine-protein kinase [Polyangiaceae bacterium]